MPVLLGAGAGLLTGSASWLAGLSGRESITRMAVAAVLLFLVGLFVRRSLKEMAVDVRHRLQEQERKAAIEEADRKREERHKEDAARKAGTHFDQQVGEGGKTEVFNPGRVADFIRQEMDNG